MKKYLHWLCIASICSLSVFDIFAQTAKPAYQLKEQIEVSTTGSWDKAVIIEVGSGDHAGEFKVHYDGWSSSYDRWLNPVYFRKATAATATPSTTTPKALAAKYQLNERIEVNTLGSWDKATIIAVGTTGEHENEFKVHYDGWASSYDRWLLPVYFRKTGATAANPAATTPTAAAATPKPAETAAAAGQKSDVEPRLGKYNMNSYGAVGNPPLFLGHIELMKGGKYRISRTSGGPYYGEGEYKFDAATSTVQWLSGPCKDSNWSGTFTNEREGKTHKIRLLSTTIATSTLD